MGHRILTLKELAHDLDNATPEEVMLATGQLTPRDLIFRDLHPIDYSLGSRAKEFIAATEWLAKHLVETTEEGNSANFKKFKFHLAIVLANLISAYSKEPNRYVAYSRNRNAYRFARYTGAGVKFAPMMHAIDALIEGRWVVHEKGYSALGGQRGRQSRLKAQPHLVRMLTCFYGITPEMISRVGGCPESIILKDEYKRKIDYVDDKRTTEMRALIDAYNDFLQTADITIADEAPIRPATDCRAVHRVFNNGSFELGGRFYGPFWQGNSKFRPFIRINGNRTVEMDYSATIVHQLYSQAGVDYYHQHGDNDDAYSLLGLDSVDRDVRKEAFQKVLNNSSRKSALWSISRIAPTNAAALIHAIETKHTAIAASFYTKPAVRLQYMDSLVAEDIIRACLAEKIVVLTIHDSFIVEEAHTDFMRELMRNAWKQRGLNSLPVIKVK